MRIRREVSREGDVITYEEFDDSDDSVILATYQEADRSIPVTPTQAEALGELLKEKGLITDAELATAIDVDVKGTDTKGR